MSEVIISRRFFHRRFARGFVVAVLAFDAREVGVVDIAGDVAAVEDGAVEGFRQAVFAAAAGVNQVRQGLVDDAVGANGGGDVRFFAAVGDEFFVRRHVDAIDVREAYRRRGAGEIDVFRARVARHLDDLFAGRAAHDGIIDQQHVLPRNSRVIAFSFCRTDFFRCFCPGMMKVRPM